MDDKLWEKLGEGYACGQICGAFDSLEKCPDEPFRTMLGLLVGQKVAFAHAKRGRRELFCYLDTHARQPIRALLPERLEKILGRWIWDEVEMALIKSSPTSFHEVARRSFAWAEFKIIHLVQVWQPGSALTNVKHIGPWTQKAFSILCQNGDEILYEDNYIKKRWKELGIHLKVALPTLKQLAQKNTSSLTKRQLSILLWRITPAGIRRLARGPLDRSSFV